MKVYFAGSIRGGRSDAELYQELIKYIQNYATVLTEHVGKADVFEFEKDQTPEYIYKRDISWLEASDLVIAEATLPSLGVGYELAYAEKKNIKTFVLYRPSKAKLSAMIGGDSFFSVHEYETLEEAKEIIDSIFKEH